MGRGVLRTKARAARTRLMCQAHPACAGFPASCQGLEGLQYQVLAHSFHTPSLSSYSRQALGWALGGYKGGDMSLHSEE